jgi:hypothetical protein
VVRAVALLGLVACALSACGGEGRERLSPEEYAAEVRAIEEGVEARDASRLFFALVAGTICDRATCRQMSDDECSSMGRQFGSDLHAVVSQVDALEPPPDAEPIQARFLVAARESVATVDDAVDDLEAGTLECGRDLNRRIYGLESTARAEQAIEELAAKGYAFGAST